MATDKQLSKPCMIDGVLYQNLYKERPFKVGKMYNIGVYVGVCDSWSSDFGSFIFNANDKSIMIHPKDTDKLETIKIL